MIHVEGGSNLFISQSVFKGLSGFEYIILNENNGNVYVENSEFKENTENGYIWSSLQSNVSLINTVIENTNECTEDIQCISFIDSDAFIDEISASNTTVTFGHLIQTENDTFNTLYAVGFVPETVLTNINLVHFGKNNGKIIFSPCIPFDSESMDQTEFEGITSRLNENVTNIAVYDESGDFYRQTFFCNDTSLCFIR